jgi:hypothetical protein
MRVATAVRYIGPKRIGLRCRETAPRTIEVGSDVSPGQLHFALSSKPELRMSLPCSRRKSAKMLLFRCTTQRRLVRPSSARRSQALYATKRGNSVMKPPESRRSSRLWNQSNKPELRNELPRPSHTTRAKATAISNPATSRTVEAPVVTSF